MNRDIFRTRLTVLRKKKHMTQAEMAALLGITRSAYTCYETGVTMPAAEGLCKLADLFDISVDYLLGRKEDPAPYHFGEPGYAEGLMALSENYRCMDEPRRRATRVTVEALGLK